MYQTPRGMSCQGGVFFVMVMRMRKGCKYILQAIMPVVLLLFGAAHAWSCGALCHKHDHGSEAAVCDNDGYHCCHHQDQGDCCMEKETPCITCSLGDCPLRMVTRLSVSLSPEHSPYTNMTLNHACLHLQPFKHASHTLSIGPPGSAPPLYIAHCLLLC